MNRRRLSRKPTITTITQGHNNQELNMGVPLSPPSTLPSSVSVQKRRLRSQEDAEPLSSTGRERLLQHRVQMAGKVWIPEVWGKEEFLKEWRDITAFDRSLMPNGLVSAKSALIEECSGRPGTAGSELKGCGSTALVLTDLN